MPETTSIVFRNLLHSDPELEELLRVGLNDGTLKLINMAAEHGFEFVAWISQEEARKREQPDRVARRPVNVQYRRRRRSRSDESGESREDQAPAREGNGHSGRSNGRSRSNGETRTTNGERRRRRRSVRVDKGDARETRERTADIDDLESPELISDTNGDHDLVRNTNGDAREPEELMADTNGDTREPEELIADTNGDAREPEELIADTNGDEEIVQVSEPGTAGDPEAITPDRARPRRSRRSVRRKNSAATTPGSATGNGSESPADSTGPSRPGNSLPSKLW